MTDVVHPTFVVVGSVNLDVVVPVHQLPLPGQTVLGADQSRRNGGSGANQAIAAARLGGSVAMIGRVGADESGPALIDGLKAEGVDTAHVVVTTGVPTSRALIAVNPVGEQTVIITPGANARLTSADCEAATDLLSGALVTLLQQEVAQEVNAAAARLAGGLVLLKPAPARTEDNTLLGHVDVLLPNRSELAALLGLAPGTLSGAQDVVEAVRGIREVGAVLVPLGAEGVVLLEDGVSTLIPPFPVDVVDTTAADDCFRGALACALTDGQALREAAVFAAAASAVSTTRPGSQTSLPTRDEVERFLAARP
jgi:ribokinase